MHPAQLERARTRAPELAARSRRHALVLAGQGRHVARSFTPHVTVAYSHAALLEVTPIEPVAWRMDGIALVHSIPGQADYQVLARWPVPVPPG